MQAYLAGAHWATPPPDGEFRPLTVQQSHSSGVLAGSVFVKVYRRLTAGPNPEVEVLGALTGSGCAPVLCGWVEHDGIHLALLQEYLPGARDGWTSARGFARSGSDDVHPAEAFDAKALGRTTAHLHAALAQAFPTDTTSGRALRERLTTRLAAVAAESPEVAGMAPALQDQLTRLDTATAIPVQRIHGDLHLGQVLWTARGWQVIDFEGEPGHPLEERTAPDSPWRDVAGMLRSFDYAGIEAAHAFLDGYGTPPDNELLTAYLIDKAVYEVAYESRHRPDWVPIPLTALRRIASSGRTWFR
jgi:maltokinase